jgi:uncharacterized membrane protein
MQHIFSSRKFLLFLLVILVATAGWIYALVFKTDQLATISTFLVTLLTAYTGANLTDTHLANKLTVETAATPDPAAGATGDQQNG